MLIAVLAGGLMAAPAQARQMTSVGMVALPPADIVVLGEVHDNPKHHRNQARAIRALHPRAVVFEMLTPEQAEIVNRSGLKGDELAQAIGWADSGWPDFALYAPVFAALGDARVYGAAVPDAAIRQAMSGDLAGAFGVDAAGYGLTVPLPAEEESVREAGQQEAHCNALPDDMLPGMVAAQRLRDAAFARTAAQAFADVGRSVIVITGSGHARTDWGIPGVLSLADPDLLVLSVGQIERGGVPAIPPFDLWLVTAPVPRDDPCAGFRAAPAESSDGGG